MTFLLDENFTVSAVEFLTGKGHVALKVLDFGEPGLADREIFALAQKKQAVLLTTDRDFFHTIPHLFASHHGVIVIALRQPNRAAILQRMQWILERVPADDFANRVFQLRDHSWVAIPPLSHL